MRSNLGKKGRAASLAILTVGIAFSSFCSAVDFRQNAVAGTMSFVKGWVGDLWTAFIPGPDDFVGNAG